MEGNVSTVGAKHDAELANLNLNTNTNTKTNNNTNMNENAYDKLRGSIGTHWSGNNITTILGWVTIASYNVEALEMSISLCRETIRRNTVLGLVLSAGTGSLSVTNFGLISSKNLQTVFNILFTMSSYNKSPYRGIFARSCIG